MNDLTKGPVGRHILRLSAFIALGTVFQTLYFLADLYWVGRLGKEAIAGVGLAGNLMMVVIALTQTLGVGTTSLLSQAIGTEGRPRGGARAQPVARAVEPGRPRLRAGALRPAPRLRGLAGRGRGHRRPGCRLPELVHTRALPAVPPGGDERRAAGNRGHEGADAPQRRHRRPQHRARARADLRLGDGSALRRRGGGHGHARRGRVRPGRGDPLLPPGVEPAAVPDLGVEAPAPEVGGDPRHRAARGRRVRPHRGLHDVRLRHHPALRRRGPGGLRHRGARHAGAVPPDHRHRLRHRPRGRPELRGAPGRARPRELLRRGPHERGPDVDRDRSLPGLAG